MCLVFYIFFNETSWTFITKTSNKLEVFVSVFYFIVLNKFSENSIVAMVVDKLDKVPLREQISKIISKFENTPNDFQSIRSLALRHGSGDFLGDCEDIDVVARAEDRNRWSNGISVSALCFFIRLGKLDKVKKSVMDGNFPPGYVLSSFDQEFYKNDHGEYVLVPWEKKNYEIADFLLSFLKERGELDSSFLNGAIQYAIKTGRPRSVELLMSYGGSLSEAFKNYQMVLPLLLDATEEMLDFLRRHGVKDYLEE